MLDTVNRRRVATLASTRTYQVAAEDARPGMGAGRMAIMRWLSRLSRRHSGYQPRHRSTRRAAADADWNATQAWDEPFLAWDDEPTDAGQWPAPEPQADQQMRVDRALQLNEYGPQSRGESDFHDHLSSDQLRHLLEGCALDDVARIVRPLVQIIAHSSHSATTLATAWGEFRRSTRDAYALHIGMCRWSDFFRREELGFHPAADAVERKLREADHAWRMLTTGVS